MKTNSKAIQLACSTILLSVMMNAHTATTDIANAPLITSPTSSVLPNVFLVLDDSGSMGWDYMPDNANDFRGNKYGAASSQCNGVYYDPSITYSPPVYANGTSYPNASFTAARTDGFDAASNTVNLSSAFRQLGGSSDVAAYYYVYSGAQTTEAKKDYYNTNSIFYKECNSTVDSTTKHDGTNPVNTLFTKVTVSSTSGPGGTDERTNFANWYSYYRTRMLTMKTATGKAFSSIGSTFRVGYASINNNTTSDILQLATFDATQKGLWYGKLYDASPGNRTPLREALSKVGRMYANLQTTFNGETIVDPMQYSCQQNFTILTTDGFWNNNAGFQLDGTSAIGNQDYFEPRPMYDGSDVVQTTVTPYTTIQQRQTVTSGAVTVTTYERTVTENLGACTQAATTPANVVTTLTDNSKDIQLAISSTNPNPNNNSRCYDLSGASVTDKAWLCRSTFANNFSGSSQVTDGAGTTWYLVSDPSNSLPSGCTTNRTAFNSTNYSTRRGACPGTQGVTGSSIKVTPWSYTQTISGATTTVVDEYQADQSTTQTTTNGISGPVSALTPSTLTYNFVRNVSTSSTTPTSDVTTAPVAGASTTTCMAAPLPPVGASAWTSTTTSTGGTGTPTILSTVGPTAGTPVTTGTSSGGTSNTLADVAEYYYITDLRTTDLGNHLSGATGTVNGTDISANNVPSSGLDAAQHQHMTTFTLGLGARGRMIFDPAYESATSGDFHSVKIGATPTSTVCPWQTGGSCNWPTPGDSQIENIDDLWHAAVNGRGSYFSAANPTGLATALSSALAGVSARTGAAAAATTSNAFVTQGDNFLFRSTFVSQEWTGELFRQQLDITTGVVLSTVDWSARDALDANASRNIYFFRAGATNNLNTFNLTNLTAAGLNANFELPHISLSQLCGTGATCLANWTANTSYLAGNEYRNGTTWYRVNSAYTSAATFGAQDTANASVISGPPGANLVNFLRGDRSREGAETDNINGKYYRQRNHVLGDIVNSETNYVRAALSPNYADPGYSSFKTAMLDRQPIVYVGANDGMLHAFYAASGTMDASTGHAAMSGGVTVTGGGEAWAFIPTEVMPNLYKLASKDYRNDIKHQFYVDGSPLTADICTSNCASNGGAVWKTILVGGLNAGGKSYYALDITNPAQPKALWEFTDPNLGYSFGNPKVVKLKNGTWVVLFTSGYNNTTGDGQGYLYVLNAYTGQLIRAIGTGVGSTATPSGLGKLDAPLVTPGVDATATAVYAGDMLGNLWRFDINNDIGAAGYDAQLLATLRDASGNAQPITTKPLISLVGNTLVVYIGTGRYLGSSDQNDTSQQSFYAIKDTFPTGTTPSTAYYGNPRTQGTFVQQTQTTGTCPAGTAAKFCTTGQSVVLSSNHPVDFGADSGWYFDFSHASERVNTDSDIIDGTIVINTNAPNSSSCSVGGDSYQYQIDYKSGGPLNSSTTGVVGKQFGNELATRPVIATLADGKNIVCTQGSGGNDPICGEVQRGDNEGDGNTVSGVPSRKSWRMLLQQ